MGEQVLRERQRGDAGHDGGHFQYPKFLTTYESRTANPLPMFGTQGNGTAIHGTEGSIIVTRSGCRVIPNEGQQARRRDL